MELNLFIYLFIIIIVLVLPYINMNPPRVYTCSQSWTPLPPPLLLLCKLAVIALFMYSSHRQRDLTDVQKLCE